MITEKKKKRKKISNNFGNFDLLCYDSQFRISKAQFATMKTLLSSFVFICLILLLLSSVKLIIPPYLHHNA